MAMTNATRNATEMQCNDYNPLHAMNGRIPVNHAVNQAEAQYFSVSDSAVH